MGARGSWLLGIGLAACTHAQPITPAVTREAPACEALKPIVDPVQLPFGFYSLPVDRFADVADAGVTMVGPYYGRPPDIDVLDAAAAEGLGVVYPIGFEAARGEDGRAELEAQMDPVADHEAVVAWYVLPEESRPWVDADLAYLSWVRATVRGRDPSGRPLLSYQPNHRSRDRLAAASASFDVVTRGLYANFVGMPRAWVRNGASVIAAATGPEQTPWAVLEMFEQPPAAELGRIRDWVRHDVYASLVGGARGVLVFSGWPRKGFDAYGTYLDAYLEVVRELNGPSALATPILQGEPSGRFVVGVAEETVNIGTDGAPLRIPGVHWREVALDGSSWLYVVSSLERRVEVRLEAPCGVVTVLGPSTTGERLSLPPLGVAILRTPVLSRVIHRTTEASASDVGPKRDAFP